MLYSNTTGYWNAASGFRTLYSNTTGYGNTATGFGALFGNTTGDNNTANGSQALSSNTSGGGNTGSGLQALYVNRSGDDNTAFGLYALRNNLSGNNNTAYGTYALRDNSKGSGITAIGYSADVTSDSLTNSIVIGNEAIVDASNKIRLGNTDITHADMQVAWTFTSDRRWKENIQTLPLGLNFINDLKPVSYHRKNNKEHDLEFGIIAQELEETLKKYGFSEEQLGLIDKGADGYYSVRYNDLISTLIKAVQEQQQIIDGQEQVDAKQQKLIAGHEQRFQQQETQISQLSAKLTSIEAMLSMSSTSGANLTTSEK